MPEGATRRQQTERRRPGRAAETRKGFVAVGRVIAPWGVRGDVKVEPLTDFPERFECGSALWLAGRRVEVLRSRWHKSYLWLHLEGVDSRQEAEALRNHLLEVPEEDLMPLAEGQYYRFQVLGLEVFTSDGHSLGRVAEILSTGANDVFVVRGPEGEVLLPAIDDVVREVDVAGGRMVVEPPE